MIYDFPHFLEIIQKKLLLEYNPIIFVSKYSLTQKM